MASVSNNVQQRGLLQRRRRINPSNDLSNVKPTINNSSSYRGKNPACQASSLADHVSRLSIVDGSSSDTSTQTLSSPAPPVSGVPCTCLDSGQKPSPLATPKDGFGKAVIIGQVAAALAQDDPDLILGCATSSSTAAAVASSSVIAASHVLSSSVTAESSSSSMSTPVWSNGRKKGRNHCGFMGTAPLLPESPDFDDKTFNPPRFLVPPIYSPVHGFTTVNPAYISRFNSTMLSSSPINSTLPPNVTPSRHSYTSSTSQDGAIMQLPIEALLPHPPLLMGTPKQLQQQEVPFLPIAPLVRPDVSSTSSKTRTDNTTTSNSSTALPRLGDEDFDLCLGGPTMPLRMRKKRNSTRTVVKAQSLF